MRKLTLAVLLLSVFASIVRAGETYDVTVRVQAGGRQSVRDAYVALVPEWQAPARPVVEKVIDRDTAHFSVPAGRYHVIAGAPGFAVATRGPISISEMHTESIAITPLREVRGTITDDRGVPVSGARVSTIHAAVAPGLGALSELAVRHLAVNFSALTDDDGRWTLQIPSAKVPLLAHATQRAAEWRLVDANDSRLDVVLREGASLTVLLDRIDRDAIVTLIRDETTVRSSIPAGRQEQIWARAALAKELVWDALPHGRYRVVSRYPGARYFASEPVTLATVVLAPGGRESLQTVLPPSPPVVTTAAFFADDVAPAELHGARVYSFGGTEPREIRHVIEEVIGGSVFHIRATDATDPILLLSSDRFLAASPRRDQSREPVSASVHDRADVTAQLRSLEKDLPLPSLGSASVIGCAGKDQVLVPLTIRPGGFMSFAAPSDCRSLILVLPPFEPVLIDRALQRGDQSLGELPLRAAGSAEVRVTRGDQEPVAGSAVEVLALAEDRSVSTVVATAVTGDDGRARFPALPVHRSLGVVAKSGSVRSDTAPLHLLPGERGVIDPLPLRRPATLTIAARIDEQTLQRLPAAKILAFFVTPADPFRIAERQQQSVTARGEAVVFKSLAPGQWFLMALINLGSGAYAHVNLDPVELEDGEDRRISPRLRPAVFDGVVTAHGKPVVAKVHVELDTMRPAFMTDANGRFHVVLEKPGTFRVAVEKLEAQGNEIPVGMVAFTDESRPIELDVSQTATITVRTRKGEKPATQTRVTMSRRDVVGDDAYTSRIRVSDQSGEATFTEVPPGAWTFEATDPASGSTGRISVTVADDQVVELVLRQPTTIEGTAYGPAGGTLPRAIVECITAAGSGNVHQSNGTTDLEGKFSIAVAASTPARAECSVITGLGRIEAFRAVPGERVDVRMSGASGSVTITNWRDFSYRGMFWLVGNDGRAVNLGSVERASAQGSPVLTIPSVPAGRWRVVAARDSAAWDAIARGMGATLAAEAEVNVRPGDASTITLSRMPPR